MKWFYTLLFLTIANSDSNAYLHSSTIKRIFEATSVSIPRTDGAGRSGGAGQAVDSGVLRQPGGEPWFLGASFVALRGSL